MTLGNQVRGEQQHSSKLTASEVRDMRQLARGGMGPTEIQRFYYPEVSVVAVWKIIRGKAWRHVTDDVPLDELPVPAQ